MITVDTRSRFVDDAVSLDPATFVDEHVPALPDARSVEAGRGAARLGLAPLTLDVDGEPLTFRVDGERLVVQRGADDALVVALDRAAFSDLVQDVASTFGLQMTGRANVEGGSLDGFLEWEPVLRCLLDGRPVYEPGTIDVPRPRRRAARPAPVVLARRRPAGGRALPRRGGLPAPRGRVHRRGDGGGVGRARRRHRRGRARRRRVVVGAHERRRVVPGADPRLQPEVADAARAAPQRPVPVDRRRSPTTSSCNAIPTSATRPRVCSRRSVWSRASPT